MVGAPTNPANGMSVIGIETKPRRTSMDRAIEHKRELTDIVTSIWFEAYRRGENHNWILEQTKTRVYEHRYWKDLAFPRWARAEVQAAGMTMLNAAEGWMLANVWVHAGVAYANNWDNLPEPIRELIRQDKLRLTTIWSEYSQRFIDKAVDQIKVFANYSGPENA